MKGNAFSAEKRDLLRLLLSEVTVGTPGGSSFQVTQVDGYDAFPLSFSQRRLWFIDQLEPGNAFYNFPLAVELNVSIHPRVLERSVNEIIRRHEVLRTVFRTLAGEPMQVVLPDLKLQLGVIDLRDLDHEAQNAEVTRLAAEMSQHPFDLATGPLLRAALLQRAHDDHVFLLVMHHIISDGWSLGIFWKELVTLYNAFYVNQPSRLAELPIQYADFAVWQRERLRGELLANLVSYWKQQLAGMPALQLPTDRPRPAVLSYRGAFHEIALPRSTTEALRALGQREGATLFMTLLAAFAVLLQRYAGQDDIVVGSYVASRDRAELEDLIGFFVNSLVLRADLTGDPTFRSLIGRVRDLALDAYAHQELPFEKLVEELQPERDLSRNPLFQVSFQVFTAKIDQGSATMADNSPEIALNRGMAIFDMSVNIWDGPDGLSGHIEYSTDLFEPETIARFASHFRNLLNGVLANPDARLSSFQVLGETELQQLFFDWNRTHAEIPNRCVHHLFEEQAKRTPNAVAIAAGSKEMSYETLNGRANQLASRLRKLRVGLEEPVGICVERGLYSIVGILGILKAGGAYVPLDPSYPTERLEFMLKDSGAKVVLSERGVARLLPKHTAATLLLDDEDVFAGQSDVNPVITMTPDNLCYVIYTSGSTGKPKGVAAPHRGTVNRLRWMWTAYPFEPEEVVCQKTALSFVDSIWEMFGGLLRGIKTVLLPDETVKDLRKLVSALAAESVTRIVLVPSLLRTMLATGMDLADKLPRLRYWTLSGEALPYDLYVEFRQSVPRAILLNLYGSSEVAADVLCCDLNATAVRDGIVPIGRPIANTGAYVLDRNLAPVPIGVPGELYVCGFGLARGYHNRPDMTVSRFIANPFSQSSGDRLYKTGDQVRYRGDGQIEYLGRLDHQVKLRGYRIELGEIETALCEHELVSEAAAAVVSRPGQDDGLIGYVLPKQGLEKRVVVDPGNELTRAWQNVWDETYLKSVPESGTFNTIGWNSSFTGAPISATEMREWVDQTVERILSFKPKRVLEIGCGTGLILLRVAPRCEHYVGTDFSRVALDQVRTQIQLEPEKYKHVDLQECTANVQPAAEGPFDLVVLNSVIQYFPSVEYLTDVLKLALTLTAQHGAVFVGDVRSLPLLPAFHASVELHRAPDSLDLNIVQGRVLRRMAEERELAVNPVFFHNVHPAVSHITIDLKRGTLVNEVNQFRYDATLWREQTQSIEFPAHWLEWNVEVLTIDQIREWLAKEEPETLGITGIPNARILKPVKAIDLLSGQQLKNVGELRQHLSELNQGCIDPEVIWALGREASYDVSVGLLGTGADGSFDVLMRRRRALATSRSFGFPSLRNSSEGDYVTHPAVTMVSQSLISKLRSHLQERLPQYMVPASIVLLERMPRTPNGKVDRRALPIPDTVRPGSDTYCAPRTQIERRLAAIWVDVLNFERVSVFDNFFELGGHSLLATQLVSRIEAEFGQEIPVRTIFEAPTIATLALKIVQTAAERRPRQGQQIGRLPRAAMASPVVGSPDAGT